MKISYRWLKETLGFELTPEQLAEKLTSAGLPVEAMEPLAHIPDSVIVARIDKIEAHPNADRLSLTSVSDGVEQHSVVCGAGNIKVGDRVPFATPGSSLPGGLKIKRSKIRGVESEGMLCSSDELGLELIQESDGLLHLPQDMVPGLSLNQALQLNDWILDIELTYNRSDCLSLRGLVAEIGAIVGKPLELDLPSPPPAVQAADISVELNTENCSAYWGRVIEGVKVGPSPLWLQLRLLASGLRPINNIVDITNLVMLEWGQPLHAFDLNKLPGKTIGLRQAREGEEMITLDGKPRKLDPAMMLVTAGDHPVAIAGVMGSEDSEVDESTQALVLESAAFNPINVRATAKALGIVSEAASRFEKGIDPVAVTAASDRAAALIAQIAGGKVGPLVMVGEAKPIVSSIEVSLSQINGLLGTEIPRDEARRILTNLGLGITGEGDGLTLTVPGRRRDLAIWQDIAEEIGRIYGIDKVPATLPQGVTTPGSRSKGQAAQWQVRDILMGAGLSEVVSYAFISPADAQKCLAPAGVLVDNPLTYERSLMRGDMLPSILEVVAHNLAHGQRGAAIFELGSIYHPAQEGLPSQHTRLVGALAGKEPLSWQGSSDYNFFAAKGAVEQILEGLGIEAEFDRTQDPRLHPGRSADILSSGSKLGFVGQVHPQITRAMGVERDVYYFDLDFQALVLASGSQKSFRALSRFPATTRDLAVEVERGTPVSQLLGVIQEAGGSLLESVACFDVYSGPNLAPEKKSVAFALSFRHSERTLTDHDVTKQMERIVAGLAALGAQLRG
jgi:phenylalanyl-tRNA synthetase beta chain